MRLVTRLPQQYGTAPGQLLWLAKEFTDEGEFVTDDPELETVSSHDDIEFVAAIDDLDSLDDTMDLELEFLTALVWAPDDRVREVMRILVGDAAIRAGVEQPRDDVIPLGSPFLLRPEHAVVFGEILFMLDESVPVTVTLLSQRLAAEGRRPWLRDVLLELAAPTGRGPLPGGADLPHIAAILVDGWYRRGYTALLRRMGQVTSEAPTADLAGHWAALTEHQLVARRRWLAVRQGLDECS